MGEVMIREYLCGDAITGDKVTELYTHSVPGAVSWLEITQQLHKMHPRGKQDAGYTRPLLSLKLTVNL